ncbi:hypothetical protein [Nostoc sp.]|uniref:hypothetical protein n=1 Tax=Nostoc sp. TaxID=1180 RepID=UPI002FF91EC8
MSKTYISVALRRQVYERAKACCEYCLIPDVATFAPHEIDHLMKFKMQNSKFKMNKKNNFELIILQGHCPPLNSSLRDAARLNQWSTISGGFQSPTD